MVRIDRVIGPAGAGSSSKTGKKSASKGKPASSGEQVRVADSAALREKAKLLLADMPEVRLDRIEAIRDALEQGAFQMDERKLAIHIITNALAERPW